MDLPNEATAVPAYLPSRTRVQLERTAFEGDHVPHFMYGKTIRAGSRNATGPRALISVVLSGRFGLGFELRDLASLISAHLLRHRPDIRVLKA